jgi:ribosomal protein L29
MKKTETLKSFKLMDEKHLTKNLSDSYAKLQKLKFSHKFGKIKDKYEISKSKKDIARILTVLRAKAEIK